jgi:hypothetical protein
MANFTAGLGKQVLVALGIAALAAACGGQVVAGTGGSGGSIPPECAVPTELSAPYPVTFEFVSAGGAPAFLAENCATEFEVTSCADGYITPIARDGNCTVDCSTTNECIQCGACPTNAIEVTPSAPRLEEWSGLAYDFGKTNTGCSCHTSSPAQAGKYRVVVPVYSSETDALAETNATSVTVDFELPAPNGVVTVALSGP